MHGCLPAPQTPADSRPSSRPLALDGIISRIRERIHPADTWAYLSRAWLWAFADPPAALISNIAAGRREGGLSILQKHLGGGTRSLGLAQELPALPLLTLALLPSCNEKQNKVLRSTIYCKATKIHFRKKSKQQQAPENKDVLCVSLWTGEQKYQKRLEVKIFWSIIVLGIPASLQSDTSAPGGSLCGCRGTQDAAMKQSVSQTLNLVPTYPLRQTSRAVLHSHPQQSGHPRLCQARWDSSVIQTTIPASHVFPRIHCTSAGFHL